MDNRTIWAEAKEQAEENEKGRDWIYILKAAQRKKIDVSWQDPDAKKGLTKIAVEKLGISPKDIEKHPEIYLRMAEKHITNSYTKAEHLDDAQRRKIAKQYSSNPGKWSVRTLATSTGHSKKQVEKVVAGLSKHVKSEKHIQKKQSDHARWRGKKLPNSIKKPFHEGRNKQIATRPETSMEKPISRWMREMGIKFQSQVDVGKLVGSSNPELGIVDFYIPSKKMIVNADGGRHRLKNVSARISKQDSLLRSKGYKVVHISDTEMSQGKAKGILKGAVAGKEKKPEKTDE